MKIKELLEYASAGASSAGGMASVSSGLGGPMMPIIRRMPAGQSFFGPATGPKIKKKKRPKHI
jgi:hypothetical protein